ncbi:hypothetical protein BT69DRAFT_1345735 [Atractiella rhizophila]|nr:hypothetical protein BT69DRAFT_1345735 [Atractiella rhizophila]
MNNMRRFLPTIPSPSPDSSLTQQFSSLSNLSNGAASFFRPGNSNSSTSNSNGFKRSDSTSTRDGGRGSDGGHRPMDSLASLGSGISGVSAGSTSSRNVGGGKTPLGEEEIWLELLSAQAAVEARSGGWEVMGWEEVEKCKKAYQSVTKRLSSAQSKLSLEMRIRSASRILDAASSPPIEDPKISSLMKEAYDLMVEETELKTKLLRHYVAVLSRVLGRREQEDVDDASASASGSVNGVGSIRTRTTSTPNGLRKSASSTPLTSPRSVDKFEGPHLFAGNANSSLLSKSFASPPSSRSQSPALFLNGAAAGVDVKAHEELKSEVETLRKELTQAKADAMKEKESSIRRNRLDDDRKDREILRLNSMVNVLEERVAQGKRANEDVGVMEEALKAAKENEKKFEGEIEYLEDLLKKMEQEEEARKAEIEELKDRIATLEDGEGETERLRAEIEGLQEQLGEAGGRSRGEEEKMSAALREMEEKDAKSRQGMEEERKRAKESLRTKLTEVITASSPKRGIGFRRPSIAPPPNAGLFAKFSPEPFTESRQSDLPSWINETLNDFFDKLSTSMKAAEREKEGEFEDLRKQESDARAATEQTQQRVEELESEIRILENEKKGWETNAATSKAEETVRLNDEIKELNRKLDNAEKDVIALKDLFIAVPDRSKVPSSDDLRTLKTAFDNTGTGARPMGNFMQDLAANRFSTEAFIAKVKGLIAADKMLVDKLVKFEASQDTQKSNADRLQKMLLESKEGLVTYKQQVSELEERLDAAMEKEVNMLTTQSDLQESIDGLRSDKAKFTAVLKEKDNMIKTLEAERSKLGTSMSALQKELESRPVGVEDELEELKEKLRETEDQLDEVSNTYQDQRIKMLDELNKLQQETGNLRAQLRAEQRKNQAKK